MRLRFIPSRADYAELFLLWRGQADFARYNPLKVQSLDECRERLSSEGSDFKTQPGRDSYRWFAELDNAIVGTVSLWQWNEMMLFAEIGYGVDAAHHGKGIGTEMVGFLVQKVFEESNLRKLVAYVHEQNQPSCRVLEKNGFQREGLLREHYLIGGRAENEVIFGLLRSDWRRASPATGGNDSDCLNKVLRQPSLSPPIALEKHSKP